MCGKRSIANSDPQSGSIFGIRGKSVDLHGRCIVGTLTNNANIIYLLKSGCPTALHTAPRPLFGRAVDAALRRHTSDPVSIQLLALSISTAPGGRGISHMSATVYLQQICVSVSPVSIRAKSISRPRPCQKKANLKSRGCILPVADG